MLISKERSLAARVFFVNLFFYFSFLDLRKPILQLLSIRESESKLVSRLFIFEFFQGAAIALYFIASIAIFVDHLPSTELPKVFILSAFLLWLFGFLYSKIEHRLLTKHLVYFVLIFNGLSMAMFRLFMHWETEKWFLYIFLGAFNIFYLFNNLEFWGLVALLFDVRQSKRLFTIVSAWDGPSRLVGYGIAGIFAYVTGSSTAGVENLLWIAAFFMLVSIILFIPLARSPEMNGLAPTHNHHYATQSLQHLQAALTGNKLIRNAAIVSFFSFCFYLVTNFVLYGYVKSELHTDKSLAGFFAVFLVISRGLALIIKPLFINRLLDQLGLKKSLLFSPVILLVLCGLTFFFSTGQSSKMVFYMFVIMAVAVDILRSAIQSPVLLATLQPLPAQQRLRGHTIIKGLMDPFSFLATGILLLVILSYGKELNFGMLSALLFVITLVWIYFAFSVDRNYINMLTAAIRKRSLDERDISITDSGSLNFLLSRLQDGNGEEALSVLHLVSAQPAGREKFYLEALHHAVPDVRHAALDLIRSQQQVSLLPELKQLLYNQASPESLPHFIRTVGFFDSGEDLSPYLLHDDKEVSNAAAMVLLSHADSTQQKIGEDHLAALYASGEVHRQLNALWITGELRMQQFSGQVQNLLMQDDEQTRYHALVAAGKLSSENLVSWMMAAYAVSVKDADLLDALRVSGENAIPGIGQFLRTASPGKSKRQGLFIVLGKIGGTPSLSLLQECLQLYPQDSTLLIGVLYQLHFSCTGDTGTYRKLLRQSLETAVEHLYLLNRFRSYSQKYILVSRAIELELTVLKDKCIWLFSFLYDAHKIRRAKDGFDVNTKEFSANSFELIEMTVPKEYAGLFILLFEQAELAYKIDQLKKTHKDVAVNTSEAIRNILADDKGVFNDWTKAVLMYTLKKEKEEPDEDMARGYLLSENPMLREIAAVLLNSESRISA